MDKTKYYKKMGIKIAVLLVVLLEEAEAKVEPEY